ncbi:hypothetical protein N0V93_003043 [Gnomoniopsis smithogilvyi]|uniref:PLC-like phosphodiesterase n=1 Tax=Gnomoniopsis smithogilvyi TaxID=1191159 RepID=A0A9W8YYL8_9PEZI|nr:hypothetical protein N0V93_003043 [Gnomoniopsis smithogilvyi]
MMRSLCPISALAILARTAAAATVCNGYAELCDKLYSNVTFIGSHDSAFVGVLPVDNQFDSVADQLSIGVRFLQAQSHLDGSTVELCHTTCTEEDGGSLQTWLETIVTFLEANANEVVTLLITNGDGLPGSDFAAAFEAAGADTYAYSPGATLALADWPTLGELIDAGSRLVVFMDYPADDSDYSLFGIDIPNEIEASTTNGVDSTMAQVNECNALYGKYPSFILFDWISVGDFLEIQAYLNGVGTL